MKINHPGCTRNRGGTLLTHSFWLETMFISATMMIVPFSARTMYSSSWRWFGKPFCNASRTSFTVGCSLRISSTNAAFSESPGSLFNCGRRLPSRRLREKGSLMFVPFTECPALKEDLSGYGSRAPAAGVRFVFRSKPYTYLAPPVLRLLSRHIIMKLIFRQ